MMIVHPQPANSTTTATAQIVTAAVQPEIHTAQETGFVTLNFFGHTFAVNPMLCVLFFAIAWVMFYLWKAQHRQGNDFDVWDLIMDTVPRCPDNIPTTRRSSLIKIAFSFAFGVTTWVIIDSQLKGTLTFEIFGLYMGAVFSTVCAKLFWDKPFDPQTLLAMWGNHGGQGGGAGGSGVERRGPDKDEKGKGDRP